MQLPTVMGVVATRVLLCDAPLIKSPSIQQFMNVWGKLDDGADIERPRWKAEGTGQELTRDLTYRDNDNDNGMYKL